MNRFKKLNVESRDREHEAAAAPVIRDKPGAAALCD
jgi:hypothetical protein